MSDDLARAVAAVAADLTPQEWADALADAPDADDDLLLVGHIQALGADIEKRRR